MDYNHLVRQQREFFFTGKTLNLEFRKDQLGRLKSLVQSNENNIIHALESDFRKSPFETYISETQFVLEEINLFCRKLNKWMKHMRVPSNLINFPSSSRILKEPYGVSLIISPWNYPFQLCMMPLTGAIAAGNCAILKPSELAPSTSSLLENIINANFPKEYIHVVSGGAEETQGLLNQKFDFIFFTGSTRVGKIVAESAARSLTPVTLELGGKSPCIVEKDYSLKLAAKRIIWGKFFNGGQTCIAPDYLYVRQEIHDPFIEQLKLTIREYYGEDPKRSPDFPRIISRGHFERLRGYLDPARIIYGGDLDENENYISPTLMDNITWDDRVMKEEIFGPILPVLIYRDIDELIHHLKMKEKPLSAYLFTHSREIRKKILTQLSFGGGAINDTVSHYANSNLPFGGVGMSGLGAYHGWYSFNIFSHSKSVLEKKNWPDIPLRYPPYTSSKAKWTKLAYKFNINL